MVNWKKSELERIYSAMITPFYEDENVNYKAISQLVEMQLKLGVEGFYCCGSSGEGLLLTIDERKRIVECVLDQVNGRVPVIAHVGTIRTADVVELALHARDIGCKAISMIPPYYYKYSMDEIFRYYEEVATAVTDMPIILYNIPQFTGVEFSKSNASRLLNHPNIVGIKHTSQNLYSMERMLSAYPDKIIINGFDEQYLGALAMGATATISTTANLFAPLFKGIRNAYRKGCASDALLLQEDLNKRVEELVSCGIFPATKYGCTLLGVNSGRCRKPFSWLEEKEVDLVEQTIKRPYSHILNKYI